MKIKRNEFTTSIVVIALYAVTAALMLLSAYGAVCVAWDPLQTYAEFEFPFAPGTLMWPAQIDNLLIFKISNIITWIGTFAWGWIIYATLTQKKGAYLTALITAVISFAMGLVPALIVDLAAPAVSLARCEGMPPFMQPPGGCVLGTFSIGSPHWARTFANLLVILVLVIPPVRKSLVKFASAENRYTGNVAQQIMMMSMFFFWLSIMSFLGTNFMASAHMVQGINTWQLVEIQSIGAYTALVTGVSMLGGGFILKQFKPSNSLITSLEAK